MPAPALVQREKEQSALDHLVDLTADGSAGIVVIEGFAGLGKSALANEAQRRARRKGVRIEVARATEGHRAASLSALEVVRSVEPDVDGTITRISGYSATRPFAATPQVDAMVEQLTAHPDSPTLLVAEDLQWADDVSLLVLTRLAELLDEHTVSVVATLRTPTTNPACLRAVDTLLSPADARRLRLEPLSAPAMIELCTNLLGAHPGRRLMRLLDHTGGNPLFITHLLRSLQEEGRIDEQQSVVEITSDDVPEDLTAIVLRRVDQLSEPARVAVRLASVVGPTVEPRHLAALCGCTLAELAGSTSEAIRAGVLTDDDGVLEIAHQLVREAVYDDIPISVRAELHRNLASTARRDGVSTTTVAYHEARGLLADDAEAATVVESAARHAIADNPRVALDLLDRLRVVLVATDDLDRIDAMRVELLAWTGRIDEAVETTERLVAAEANIGTDDRTRLRILLANLRILPNRPKDAVSVLEAALEDTPDCIRPRVLAELALARSHTSDGRGAEDAATEAIALAEQTSDIPSLAAALTVISRIQSAKHRYRDCAASARSAAEHADTDGSADAHRFIPWFVVGLAHLDLDEPNEAGEALRRGRACARQQFSGWTDPFYDGLACSLAFRAGQLDDTEATAEASATAARATGSMQAIVWTLSLHSIVATLRGELARAEALVTEAEQHLSGGQVMLGIDFLFLARARLDEARGDTPKALETLRFAWAVFDDLGVRNCQPLIAADLIRLAQRHRDGSTTATVMAEVERIGEEGDLPFSAVLVPWCRGLAQHDSELLAQAEHAVASMNRPLDAIAVTCDRTVVLAARGRTGEARRLRDDVLEEVREIGVSGLGRRLLSDLEAFGLGRPRSGGVERAISGWDSLTLSEQAIVDLVAEGLSNREIATARGSSIRTVETHLGRTYRKLGVKNRTQLALAAAERAGTPPDR